MLYTVNQARRKGYAKQIIETALSTLLANGYIPRYQMDEANLASKELAERVGLHKFLTTEHYLCQQERAWEDVQAIDQALVELILKDDCST